MIANYHTHTTRCRHAQGTEEEYVQNAIAGGMKILGFSDHAPYWFDGDYYSHMRMYPQELESYVNCIAELRDRYADQIEIHIGLEIEYYPKFFHRTLDNLRGRGIEYLLLGQHWVDNEQNAPYCGRPTEDKDLFVRYVDQTIEGMQQGVFTYLAHPDLLGYTGDEALYRQHMRRLCREAKACDLPLELNLWGLELDRHYPTDRFFSIVAEEGNAVILGSDSHRPDKVYNREMLPKAMEMVEKFGLHLLETVEMRRF